MPSSRNVYPRLKVNQSERKKYVAHLIMQLRDLERKTDPEDGAQSTKGKDVAARDALKIAGDLVNLLAGWALDHQAGLPLKDDAFKQFPVKTPEYDSNVRSDDDHRIEWAGRNWGGRDGVPINPILARKWLMHLVRAFPGIFNLELRLMTLTALEACDYGETQPMLMATKKNRKVNWTILQLQLKAITFVKYCEALGMKKFKALEEVAGAFGVSVNTVRSWEPRLRTELGSIEIMKRLAAAEEVGKNERDAEHGAISNFGRRDLKEFGRQYNIARRRAKCTPQR